MKCFNGRYYEYMGGGDTLEYHCICFATTESEALGFALEMYSQTEAKYWKFEPLDAEKAGCIDIANCSYTS